MEFIAVPIILQSDLRSAKPAAILQIVVPQKKNSNKNIPKKNPDSG